MFEYVVLGLTQGLLEWIPVSSEGFLVIAASLMALPDQLDLSLFLHLGTLLAVLVYFRSRIWELATKPSVEGAFILKATLVSLLVAFPLYLSLKYLPGFDTEKAGSVLLVLTGVSLIATGFLLKKKSVLGEAAYSTKDSAYVGFLQGLAVIPGLSRSGITMFGLLSRGYDQGEALEVSFLMSVPVVLAANVFIHLDGFQFQPEYLVALAVAFVVGLASMHFLMELARRVDFSWFCWFFGVLCFSAFLAFM